MAFKKMQSAIRFDLLDLKQRVDLSKWSHAANFFLQLNGISI